MTLASTYEKTDLSWRVQWSKMLKFCGKTLIYAQNPDTKKLELAMAMFCQKRLCPLCAWRRSVRTFRNVYSIVTDREFRDVEFIFLTLTVRNCSGAELPGTLDRLLEAWRIVTRNEWGAFQRSFLGTLRSLEITYNRKEKTYHPHIHALVAVPPGYFKKSNPDYISHDRLRGIWIDALNRAGRNVPLGTSIRELDRETFGARLDLGPVMETAVKTAREKYPAIDYAPQVRIEKMKNATGKGIAEVAKYTVKPGDYIDLPEVVAVLDPALRRRRLIAYGGLFKTVRNRLKLEDEEMAAGDITGLRAEDILKNPLIKKIALEWTFGGVYKITPYKKAEDSSKMAVDAREGP